MSKTLLKDRRKTEEEINLIKKADRKRYGKILSDLNKIGKRFRYLLPKIQQIQSFDTEQVAKTARMIDLFDDYCNEIVDDFKNRNEPEDWN